MEALDDMALLRAYVADHSPEAFEQLVARRIGFVYAAALRQLRDPHLAEEATQNVFILLAQKAGQISRQCLLTGWLFRATRFTALAMHRAAAKRQQDLRDFQMQTATQGPPSDPLWENLFPHLDAALETLGEQDRQALLLRFFENKSLAEVGVSLGTGEDTARKRVARALDKLHRYFDRRGITCTAALLAAALATHGTQAAPAALAKTVAAVALAKSAATVASTATLIEGTLKIMAWTKTQTAAVSLALAGIASLAVYQHHLLGQLRGANLALQQELENARAEKPAGAPAMAAEEPNSELLKLRGEVGLLRRQTNEMAAQLAKVTPPKAAPRPPAEPLPEDYPKTPDGATKGIFEAWAKGDIASFVKNFGEPGVSQEDYDKIFSTTDMSNMMWGMQIVRLGEPTNSFGPNMWFVPYTIRFNNGNEKSMRLHVAQDLENGRWYFKGGF